MLLTVLSGLLLKAVMDHIFIFIYPILFHMKLMCPNTKQLHQDFAIGMQVQSVELTHVVS